MQNSAGEEREASRWGMEGSAEQRGAAELERFDELAREYLVEISNKEHALVMNKIT